MRVRQTIFISVFLLGLALSLKVRPEETPVHIGFLLDNLRFERWQRDSKLVQARAGELGAKITVKDAEGNDDLQLQQANQLLDAGVSVLIVVPHDADKAAAIVQAAKRKGVPVVSYDRLIKNSPASLYISFDNVQVGKLQASMVLAAAPHGNFFLLEGAPSDNNAHQFERGQKLALEQAEATGHITIAGEAWCRQWSRTEAYEATVTALKKSDGKISAIVAANDEIAGGAIQALSERKLAGTVPVSGQDADLAGVVRVISGYPDHDRLQAPGAPCQACRGRGRGAGPRNQTRHQREHSQRPLFGACHSSSADRRGPEESGRNRHQRRLPHGRGDQESSCSRRMGKVHLAEALASPLPISSVVALIEK